MACSRRRSSRRPAQVKRSCAERTNFDYLQLSTLTRHSGYNQFSGRCIFGSLRMTMNKPQQVAPIDSRAAEQYWKATVARDSRSDGVFFLGVRSTRIYCRPSCPARRPLRQNVEFFRTQREAEQHGFRACLRCKPNEISAATALVQKTAELLLKNTATTQIYTLSLR